LVCTDYVTPVFRVELAGEFGRVHQIAKHHGELATFRVWGARFWCRECHLGSRLLLGRTECERLPGQGRTTCPAELEAGGILKATLRTQVLERMTTLPTWIGKSVRPGPVGQRELEDAIPP
jgi:hypothetical protein